MEWFETKKLFYDQYKYKIVMLNSLGYIFKKKQMPLARGVLDSLQTQLDEGVVLVTGRNQWRTHLISTAVFLETKRLYKEFCKATDYKIRVELTSLTVYSNDQTWLKTLCKIAESPREFWEPPPGTDAIIEEINVILTRNPTEYEYKVTLLAGEVDPGLANWIRANEGMAKASLRCLQSIETQSPKRGLYIYVRDKKVLQLISLMLNKVGRIDKLVHISDKDK